MKKNVLPAVAVAAAVVGSMAVAQAAEPTNVFEMKEVSSQGLIANDPHAEPTHEVKHAANEVKHEAHEAAKDAKHAAHETAKDAKHEAHELKKDAHEAAKEAEHKCAAGACGGKKDEKHEAKNMHEKPATTEAEHTPAHH